MIRRRSAAVVASVLVLAGCSGDVLPGSAVSSTGRAPCALEPSGVPSRAASAPVASAAPGCIPSPTASSSSASSRESSSSRSSSSGNGGSASLFAQYARQTYDTKFGDPGLLNVCRIGQGANVSAAKVTLVSPKSAYAAGCSFDLHGAGVPSAATVYLGISQSGPNVTPKPRLTTVSGLTVARFPYESSTGNCGRSIVDKGPDVTTTATVTVYARGLGPTRACVLSEAMLRPLFAVATGAAATPQLPTADPSLLSVDVCKVATAARIAALPSFAGAEILPGNFGVDCRLNTASHYYVIGTGFLRDASARAEGTPRQVGGHTLYAATSASGCYFTSQQSQGETVTISGFGSKPADAVMCTDMATGLANYLNVLKLR